MVNTSWGLLLLCMILGGNGCEGIQCQKEIHSTLNDCRLVEESFDEKELLQESLQVVVNNIDEMINGTSQIQILDLQYEYPNLVINLSEEIISYGGGNEMEHQIVARLLEWGFENTLAESMQIYIEGNNYLFPEGNMTIPCSRESYEKYYSTYE